jgi:ABC-type multidrug transport system ATPase subunit
MKYCIETSGLNHRFSNGDQVLHDIEIQVTEGSIYGFLGPNGAGKTTTLRLILGLLSKQSGDIRIFGKSLSGHRIEILRQIGSMIESPSIYGHLTARENLEVLQRVYQCPKSRVGEVLEIVGLASTGKKKAGKFSLGMKQRLSIAIALLHQPKLLVLDEPTNGLDPNGIIEVRELLKKLNKEHGITVVVSSHLLMEIEKLVSHVGIIHKGRMLFQGTLDELHQKQHQSSVIAFDTSEPSKAQEIIGRHHSEVLLKGNLVQIPLIEKDLIARLNKDLVGNGIDVYQIQTLRNDLESIFMDLVKN